MWSEDGEDVWKEPWYMLYYIPLLAGWRTDRGTVCFGDANVRDRGHTQPCQVSSSHGHCRQDTGDHVNQIGLRRSTASRGWLYCARRTKLSQESVKIAVHMAEVGRGNVSEGSCVLMRSAVAIEAVQSDRA